MRHRKPRTLRQIGQPHATSDVLPHPELHQLHRPGGLLRNLPLDAPVEDVVKLYTSLAKLEPSNVDALAGATYFRLLGRLEMGKARADAADLLEKQPASIPLRAIAALALLRGGDKAGAAAILDRPLPSEVDWSTEPDRWKAVVIAVLEANGRDASRFRSILKKENLRREEFSLLTGSN